MRDFPEDAAHERISGRLEGAWTTAEAHDILYAETQKRLRRNPRYIRFGVPRERSKTGVTHFRIGYN